MAYLKARTKGLLFIQPLTWLDNLIRCLRHHLRNLSDILSLFCDLETADGEGCAYLSEETIVQQVTVPVGVASLITSREEKGHFLCALIF